MRYKCQDCDARFRTEDTTERDDLKCSKCGGLLSPSTRAERASVVPRTEQHQTATSPEPAKHKGKRVLKVTPISVLLCLCAGVALFLLARIFGGGIADSMNKSYRAREVEEEAERVASLEAVGIYSEGRLKAEQQRMSPLEQMKAHIQCLPKESFVYGELRNLEYDVKKTDSLVSPFVGFVTYEQHGRPPRDELAGVVRSIRLTLAFQEAQWVLKKVEIRTTRVYTPSHTYDSGWEEEEPGSSGFTNVESEFGLGSGAYKFKEQIETRLRQKSKTEE